MDPLPPRSTAPLSSLSLDQNRQFGHKATMDQVGKAFEALFMQTIMKSMREAQVEGGLFDNESSKPFQSMLDGAYAELAVKKTNLGLAEAINRQFAPKTGSKATGLIPATPVTLTSEQADALTQGLSASAAAGQNLSVNSLLSSSLPAGLTAPRTAPKFITGD